MSKPRFSPRKEIKNRSFEGLLWGLAQNNRLTGPLARLRRHRDPEFLFRPTGVKRICPRTNSSSDTAKSKSKVRSSHCSPSPEYAKRKETQNISAKAATSHHHIKCTTTTLLAALMKRRSLNSATLATATHKELIRVSDGTCAQVGVWMINKCKVQMRGEGLYNM